MWIGVREGEGAIVNVWRRQLIVGAVGLGLLDTACLFASYVAAVGLTLPEASSLSGGLWGHWIWCVALMCMWWYQAIDQRLLVPRGSASLMPELFAVTKAVILSLMLTIFIVALLVQGELDRGFVLALSAISLLLMVCYRTVVRLSLWNLRRRGYHFRRVLLIGANTRAANIARILISNQSFGIQIVGYLEDDESRRSHLDDLGIRCYGKVRDLETILQDKVVDVVYISLPVRSQYETIESIAHLCEGVGVPVRMLADLFPLRMASSRLTRLGDIPILSLTESRAAGSPFSLNRLADLLVSTILIVILLPVWLLITLLIKLDSRGPVFTLEPRTAPRTHRPFNLLKFRTASSVEEAGNDGIDSNSCSEEARGEADEAFTRVGRVLVRYSLDELPELVNIWCGQISSLDPLPESAVEIETEQADEAPATEAHEFRN